MTNTSEKAIDLTARLLGQHASGDHAALIADVKYVAKDSDLAAHVGDALASVVRHHSWSGLGTVEIPNLGLDQKSVLEAGEYACAIVSWDLNTMIALTDKWDARSLSSSQHHRMIATVVYVLVVMAAHAVEENPNGHR